jgi:glycosyltransferase involved in cell wall biosynthesis
MDGTEDIVTEKASRFPRGARPLFTVFTPTRNRVHVIHRVYESLCAQTLRDFEWLVVDNASTDGTPDLISRWLEEAPFPIRYFRREKNMGKLASSHLGIRQASGTLFLDIRDADTIMPTALERLKMHWDAIPSERREGFVGITVNCCDEHGRLVGTPIPEPYVDSDAIEVYHRYRVRGEKFGFQRIDVLRAYIHPQVPGYIGYLPEGIVWNRIAKHYRTRYVNETLRTFWSDQRESLSRSKRPVANALGGAIDSAEALRLHIGWFARSPVRFQWWAIKYARCCFHLGRPLPVQWRGLPGGHARALWILGLPVGWLLYSRDDRRRRRSGEERAVDLPVPPT